MVEKAQKYPSKGFLKLREGSFPAGSCHLHHQSAQPTFASFKRIFVHHDAHPEVTWKAFAKALIVPVSRYQMDSSQYRPPGLGRGR